MTDAVGMIETRGLASSIEVADTMLKVAHVTLVRQEKADGALVTIIIKGDVSAVQAAIEAGTDVAKRTKALVSCTILPHPDQDTTTLFS
ncbi:BMC domain-containing protein [Alkalihalobacterium elongatum]|uniref:BMC domain-containing protein n=1 Tax=Alkalihalobacterium elongatum TaxID=2675466 RepID=UPI002E2DEE28|nr:BMC domain-containing protein [Alkalihalobacterium elongatum]